MKNFTLYGLKKGSKINLTYDAKTKEVTKVNGFDLQTDIIEIAEEISFSIPNHISINGIPFFPTKYEFINSGEVIYSSITPPTENIFLDDDNFINLRAKTKLNTIALNDLILYDINGRKRIPQQNQIMKESAKEHAQKLIDSGILKIPKEVASKIQWHWCHMISFRMLATEKAQKNNNLFCGTSACNGHMTNIEAAIKRFIKEFKRPLGLEVTVSTYKDSLVAKRIRYRIYDKKGSKVSHSEYFDALTDTKTDVLDFFTIYDRLVENFKC
tara:strand:+ start:865 stop:1674 length:810 start_codon:yes stop_codon:yes gene_type:complete